MNCPICGEKGCKNGKNKQSEVQSYLCTNKDCPRKSYSETTGIADDPDIIKENVRLAKKDQKSKDTNRIERKSFREYARIENALIEYNKELIALLKDQGMKHAPVDKVIHKSGKLGILHLTDTHFNELIALPDNTYDFNVASKRIQKFTHEAIAFFKFKKIEHVLVAFGGDFMNSDRRLDELLNEATNRSAATIMAVEILRYMLDELSTYFDLNVVSICGNESRAKDEIGWSDIVATDNYDHTIFEFLRYLFWRRKDIRFAQTAGNEKVIEGLLGFNILLLHGQQVKKDTEKSVQSIRGKYAGRGIIIDFVLLGHFHSCRIGDYYARGASLAGSNAYSDSGLQLMGRASQNLHIVSQDKSIISIKIDLQNVDDYPGYDISDLQDAYNPKASRKLNRGETVFRVII